MRPVDKQKDSVISKITYNAVYRDDSGLVQSVRHDLKKLSLSTLRNLSLLIALKKGED